MRSSDEMFTAACINSKLSPFYTKLEDIRCEFCLSKLSAVDLKERFCFNCERPIARRPLQRS